jgi:hypothetical protein
MPGHSDWIVAEYGFAIEVPLPEAYAFTTANVDRRPDFHALTTPLGSHNQRQNMQYDTEVAGPQAGAGETAEGEGFWAFQIESLKTERGAKAENHAIDGGLRPPPLSLFCASR